MLDLPVPPKVRFGCQLEQLLHRGPRSTLYRGTRERDGLRVIVKTSSESSRAREHAQSLMREHATLDHLRGLSQVVATHGLETDAGDTALLLEDAGDTSLLQLFQLGPLSNSKLLQLAIDCVGALEQTHKRGVVHQAFRTEHAVLGENGVLKLVGFSSATAGVLAHASQRATANQLDLAYAAPEQTGRVLRRADYRADFYAFGVSLFRLATGVLPFDQQDPLELMHAVLAQKPPHAKLLNPALPTAFSKLIAKLLAKSAEDRYQTHASLRSDLERCHAADSANVDFPLADADRPPYFVMPQRLYGRDRELSRLREAFAQASRGSLQCVVIEGPAGSGKSSLCRELSRTVTAARGYFMLGKFEAEPQSAPHRTLTQAIGSLIQQILTESTSSVALWRERFASLPESALEVLVELCPSVALVVEPKPSASEIEVEGSRRRLRHALSSALTLVATIEHPVCLVLDDLQWAGHEAVELLGDLMSSQPSSALLLLLTTRDAAAGPAAPFFSAWARAPSPPETLRLAPLDSSDVVSLIDEAWPAGPDKCHTLGRVVHARTGGNPLFVRQFLELLDGSSLLDLARPLDMAAVEARCVSENVAEVLTARIQSLSEAARDVLTVAACIGQRFEIELLEQVYGCSCERQLAEAAEAGIILGLADCEALSRGPAPACQFAHDRVHESFVGQLAQAASCHFHSRIGTSLLRSTSNAQGLQLCRAVCHLNLARGNTSDEPAERLAELNLEAARFALHAAAGADCIVFARSGIEALGARAFEQHYRLARDLHLISAEAAFGWADHETLDANADALIKFAQSPLDIARVHRLRGRVRQSQDRGKEAIAIYREALAALRIDLLEPEDEAARGAMTDQISDLLQGRRIEALVELPACEHEATLLAMELLSKLIFFAYSNAAPTLLHAATCLLVRLSLTHGNSAESANGYTFYGYLLSRDHNLDRACAFGRLAIKVAERFDDRNVLSQTYLYAYYQLLHWSMPMRDLVPAFTTAERYGLDAGSPRNTACSATTLSIARFWAGDDLAGLAEDMHRQRGMIILFKQEMVLSWQEVLLQTVLNLRTAENALVLAGPIYDERLRVPEYQKKNAVTSIYNWSVSRALLSYLLGDVRGGVDAVDRIAPYAQSFGTSLWSVPTVFLDALCRLAALEESDAAERSRLLAQVEEDCQKLARWEPHNRSTITHKLRTVQAQLAQLTGDHELAQREFAEAVELARRSGINHDEGIACELAARCHLQLGDGRRARAYLRASQRAFLRWGAVAKLRQLQERYPGLLPRSHDWTGVEPAMVEDLDTFDLLSVVRASQTISGELRADKLLLRTMQLLMENSGAEHGYMLHEREGRWYVEVGLSAMERLELPPEPQPVDDMPASQHMVASSVVHYVARTGEPLVLDNASVSELFGHDPAFSRRRVASVLCFPLRSSQQGRKLAYLENTQLQSVFTPSCVRVLQLVASQAVISLDNAQLYSSMERKISERTHQIVTQKEQLSEALSRLMEAQHQLVVQQRQAALGTLTAGIAHEIKNPLNFVTNFAEVSADLTQRLETQLTGLALPPRTLSGIEALLGNLRTAVRKVAEHGLRASAIVTRMADHEQRRHTPRERSDVNEMVLRSIELSRRKLAVDGPEIVTRLGTNVGSVEMIADDVSRVIINLLENAHHALARKQGIDPIGFKPTIVVSTTVREAHAEIRVWDNGVGIPRAELERVFLPFYTTKLPSQGTGLGLSLSQDIVERGHRGQISVDSVEGKYCELIVRLPRAER